MTTLLIELIGEGGFEVAAISLCVAIVIYLGQFVSIKP
jgi:hypothetical protein